MAKFSGRSGNMLLFTDGGRGVIVDSEFGVVVASGQAEVLSQSGKWGKGEFSETDSELAQSALATLDSTVSAPTGRLYTVPKGVQQEAKRALDWMNRHERGGTDVSVVTASVLSQGGQISFEKLRHVNKFLSRHSNDKFTDAWEPTRDGAPSAARITWGMWGGDNAQKWTSAILSRESEKALTADAIYLPSETEAALDPFQDAFRMGAEDAPEFLARVRMDGSGIDRLYKIDLDGSVYVWDDGIWDNMGHVNGDIYRYDAELDMPDGDIVDTVGKTHIVIDPSSAVLIGARLQNDPYRFVLISDIDMDEAELARDALDDEDWDLVDFSLTAAVDMTPGVDTPEERSARASTQVRDGDGKFATAGQRVIVGGNPSQVGTITRVDGPSGNVNVQLESGGTVTVPGKSVNGVGALTQTIPGNPVAIPRVDLSGILAEPRTPVNVKGPQIPGTLPAMTTKSMHEMLNNWPAWVKSQRDSFIPLRKESAITVQSSTKDIQTRLEKETGTKLYTDAYDHPLLSAWLRKTNADGARPNSLWYQPEFAVVAAGVDAGQPMTPDTSDVTPIYMAVVAADDPTAVTQLIALVPASTTQTSPMTYTRKKGDWERDPRTLADLQSATPPPVVPLDSATLEDCLDQVDSTQSDQPAEPEETVEVSDVQVSNTPAVSSTTPVAASVTLDQALMILWGPNEQAITAAGGADRNRGGAEKLRKYWTSGPGAAKIMWGTPGDWTRCVRHLGKYMGTRAKGYCALRHKEKTGMWTGDKGNLSVLPGSEFSSVDVATEDEFLDRATLSARAETLRSRMNPNALTAAGALELELDPDFQYHFGPIHHTPSIGIKGKKFRIPLVLPVGLETGDGRIVDPEAQVDLRNLPLPLLWQFRTASGHDGSVVVGRIDRMEVTKSGVRNAVGYFDTGVWGAEAERMVANGFLYGVSADMDKFEAQEIPVFAEKENEDDEDKLEKSQIVINRTRVMAVTIVAKPAFQECQILIDDEDSYPKEESPMIPDGLYVDDVDPINAAALVAAGYVADHIPVAPPKDWFDDPRLTSPTPITVTDEGRVFGHIAAWHTDHVGMANNIKPPRSRSNYAYFQTGILRTEEGSDVSVGQLTLAGGHASLEFSARETVKHYDDTASAIADVKAGEDEFGIWVSGGLRPGTTPEQVRVFRASAPSGDWRPIKGRLELVAVCQVNVPGFPVARSLVAGGMTTALVAAGAASVARLKSDPLAEMTARLEKLEQFTTSELSTKVDPIREKFSKIRADREAIQKAELAAKAEALSARMSSFTKTASVNAELSTRAETLRNRFAEFAAPSGSKQEKKEQQEDAERLARAVNPTDVAEPKTKTSQGTETAEEGSRPKYTPETQPRNSDGKFRLILARLRENVGDNGNQAIVEKIKQAQDLASGRDYKKASVAYADLVNSIDRIDTKSLDPKTLGSMKQVSRDLAEVVANLPLPFDDQSQKIRFSDLPPVLREMTQNLVAKVKGEYGAEAAEKLAEIQSFMSGGDYYSQAEVSSRLNTLVHLLTKN